MTTPRKTQSSLRAALAQEDAALAVRLPEPVPTTTRKAGTPKSAAPKATAPKASAAGTVAAKAEGSKRSASTPPAAASTAKPPPAAAPAATAERATSTDVTGAAAKGKREKVVRGSFSMPKSEQARLKQLRAALGEAGRPCTRSELLRAALQWLASCKPVDLIARLDALPAVRKGKRRGK